MKFRAIQLTLSGLVSLVVAAACGGNPSVGNKNDLGEGGSSSDGGKGGKGGSSTDGSGGTVQVPEGGTNSGGAGGSGGKGDSACGDKTCGLGQRCETDKKGKARCVDNECDDLRCGKTEECRPAPGGGYYCADNSCEKDVDCPIHRFCNGSICVDDTCTPGEAKCDGDDIILCTPNGAKEEPAPYTCESAGYFDSSCVDAAPGAAGCTCEDDWDCPNHTTCDVGLCVGTGKEPTCTLPPAPFEKLLPQLEFRWGGENRANPNAVGKAFPWSAHVLSTPLVINLDDDNGDGKINELDFPEILFISYHGTEPGDNGVVRAVHAGGPKKGEDYFALCGTTHWFEGDPVLEDCNGAASGDGRNNALARSAGSLAAGDLDGDGVPEIVVPIETGGIQILNNKGQIITTSPTGLWPTGQDWKYPAPAIANLDFEGLAEIVVGNRVIKLKKENGELAVDKVFTGTGTAGTQAHFNLGSSGNYTRDPDHHGPMVCIADLTPDPGLEIVAGTTVYKLPSDPSSNQLEIVWDGKALNPELDDEHREGLCAVADVLGADGDDAGPHNPLDGKPEVIVIAQGNLLIFDGATGALRRYEDLNGEPDDTVVNGTGDRGGGAPNIDDFDGDGFPEIATALEKFYTVIDLQPTSDACPAWPDPMGKTAPPPTTGPLARTPGLNADNTCKNDGDCAEGAVCNRRIGECVCLHNGWSRTTEDDSSRTTSSSVFDFNGDGAAEVVYNDECYMRIYEGKNGRVYLQLPSVSRTINENPVVADVDNDGNAEIVFVSNNETIQCNEAALQNPDPEGEPIQPPSLPNGLFVYGDPTDQWVAARRIWNQHSYHVTNVTEGGSIPLHEPESWRPLNGRIYNTYRSQPRNYNVAPDLALTAIQISSPDTACGTLSETIQIVVEVRNLGDLRVGPGVVLSYEGTWGKNTEVLVDSSGDPITFTLDKSLEPGASTLVSVEYHVGDNDQEGLPDSVQVTIDGDNKERECNEDNNTIKGTVEAGALVADLRLEIESAQGCAEPKVKLTVYNEGSKPAEKVLVHLYAGDPSQGGTKLGEVTIKGPVDPGESESVTVTLDPVSLDITIWGIADPKNTIAECNDANNVDKGPELKCKVVK